MSVDHFQTLREFTMASGRTGRLHSLPALEQAGVGAVSRLPVCIRIVLESVLRHCDGARITQQHVEQLANWRPGAARDNEIPFVVARILLQDFTGVPLLVDLAAMRSAAARMGKSPTLIEPLVPVHLVVDHSVQVDHYNTPDAFRFNMELEFQRNLERYRFLKWGMQAFDGVSVVPPGIGIVHQVNLEHLARGVWQQGGLYYPDTLVGTDSHTTMINGIGVVGWGVGGIEAEAAMLGQPVYLLTPDVVGVHLTGRLLEGVTATDLVLAVTEMLRKEKVVGKFVEFFGAGVASLSVPDRATIGNMAPEYGATIGLFPPDDATVDYLTMTGRSDDEVDAFRSYFEAQEMYGARQPGEIDYSTTLELALGSVRPCVAGPRRPQDRIELPRVKTKFAELLTRAPAQGGFGKGAGELTRRYRTGPPSSIGDAALPVSGGGTQQRGQQAMARNEMEMLDNRPTPDLVYDASGADADGSPLLGHGDVLIAAITSCTNTSNPGVLLAAGLLARKAVERGLSVRPHVKTSLAPGSRVVTEYLRDAGLLADLERLGFGLVAYGCTTCIGNSGPLDPRLEEAVIREDLICAAVLSGNRNFEARIHGSIKANFLMSPPLVVAFAIAGSINTDLTRDPLGRDQDGRAVYLRDIWPTQEELRAVLGYATDPQTYRRLYAGVAEGNPLWNAILAPSGGLYTWEPSSYIAEPPFFENFEPAAPPMRNIIGARALAVFGDSVTTDHISPAGSIVPTSPAGHYLNSQGVAARDFNSYGSRRGNHEVMMRGTFANVRTRNLMMPVRADGSRAEGGVTLHQPEREAMPIYDAAMRYRADGVSMVLFAGEEYGSGSSRDWAAKGTQLLGVRAVIARSFERIHRSNLIGMNVLPLQFKASDSAQSLGISGDETFDILGIDAAITPLQDVALTIRRKDGTMQRVELLLRIDTPIEAEYYLHGGILPYVLRTLIAA
jgi:aconitate hydratase